MLEQLARLKALKDDIEAGVSFSMHTGGTPSSLAYDDLVDEIEDYYENNIQGNEANNLDFQLASIPGIPAEVKKEYQQAMQTTVSILADMSANNNKIGQGTFQSNNDILFVSRGISVERNTQRAFSAAWCLVSVQSLTGSEDITTASRMFEQCTSLVHVDVSNYFKNGNCTNISLMFYNTQGVKYIDTRLWNLEKVTTASAPFCMCLRSKIDLPDCNVAGYSGYKMLNIPLCRDISSMFNNSCCYDTSAGDGLPTKLYIKAPTTENPNKSGYYVEASGVLRAIETNHANINTATNNANTVNSYLQEVVLDMAISNISRKDATGNGRGGMFEGRNQLRYVKITDTSHMRNACQMFCFCRALVTVEGLNLSSLYLSASEILSYGDTQLNANETFAVLVNYTFRKCTSLVNCEITGTIYKSGIDLTDCTSLSKASLVSFLAALYNWDANVENKTTDDQSHVFIIGDGLTETYVDYEKMEYVAYCVEPPEENGSPMYTLDDFISPQGDMYNDGEYLVEALIYRANSRYDWSIEP